MHHFITSTDDEHEGVIIKSWVSMYADDVIVYTWLRQQYLLETRRTNQEAPNTSWG